MRLALIVGLPLLIVSGIVAADSLSVQIGENIFRINAGAQHSPKADVRELEKRVWMLERAVHQLQNQVFRLTEQPVVAQPVVMQPVQVAQPVVVQPVQVAQPVVLQPAPIKETEKSFSCYIKTTFRGTFTGTGKTLNAAKGKAMKACTDSGEPFCDDKNLKCDE